MVDLLQHAVDGLENVDRISRTLLGQPNAVWVNRNVVGLLLLFKLLRRCFRSLSVLCLLKQFLNPTQRLCLFSALVHEIVSATLVPPPALKVSVILPSIITGTPTAVLAQSIFVRSTARRKARRCT